MSMLYNWHWKFFGFESWATGPDWALLIVPVALIVSVAFYAFLWWRER